MAGELLVVCTDLFTLYTYTCWNFTSTALIRINTHVVKIIRVPLRSKIHIYIHILNIQFGFFGKFIDVCTWEFRKRNSENYIRVRASSKRFVEVSIYAKKYITLQDIFATFQGWRDYIIRSFRWYNDKHVFIERKPIKHYYYLLLSIMYFCLYCPMRMLTCFEIWFEDLKII